MSARPAGTKLLCVMACKVAGQLWKSRSSFDSAQHRSYRERQCWTDRQWLLPYASVRRFRVWLRLRRVRGFQANSVVDSRTSPKGRGRYLVRAGGKP